MNWSTEKCIDFYYGEYKQGGIFGKKRSVKLGIYPSYIEGMGFDFYNEKLGDDTHPFTISFDDIKRIYIGDIDKESALIVEYHTGSVVSMEDLTIALLGIADIQKWFHLTEEIRNQYIEEKKRKQKLELEIKEEQYRLESKREEEALKFYQDCYSFHIKYTTPTYPLFSEKNRIALVFIDEDRSLNFLKIDGYEREETNGVITYKNIHYYEKAGSISYATDVHGNYASFGGSMTGGNFSKLAAVGGGLLFGLMGMTLGAALTYKPSEQEPVHTSFSIDSDIQKIDDRSVLLNFYSDAKKQYIDIELPQDLYNFFQTYLPEKKYSIVSELEKKTVVHQSTEVIENGSLLKVAVKPEIPFVESKEISQTTTMEDFKQKVEKLKIMKDAGLLSDEEFKEEQSKLLNMI